MNNNPSRDNLAKALKYLIWAGLILICFIPLIFKEGYFFPYIVPKTLVFRITIEVIFLAYLGLAVLKKEYRPKLNLVLVLFFLYIAVVFLSSLLGDSFYFSFWSNNERSEGLLLLFHLFIYLLILIGFLRKSKDWLMIFETSFFFSLLLGLVGLGQYLNLDWGLASSGGARVSSTTGNAAYMAGYLIFNVFLGLILFFFRKNKYRRVYYALGILLQILIILNSLTRGAILSLGFCLFLFIVYLIFYRLRGNKLVRNAGIVILLLGIIFIALVFANKRADWVWNNDILRRVSSISFTDTTAQNRIMTWKSAIQGFKERPILGYGYENFYQVFDKYFNPKIFQDIGSVVWFDRGHNLIFDRLVTGGLLGLLLYLSFLFVPLIYLWKYFLREKKGGGYLMPVIFSLVMLAYFIQNLFIFEALVTYIPLFLVLAFLSQFCPIYAKNFSKSKKPYVVLLSIGLIIFLPALFIFNVKPALANKGLIDAMRSAYLKQYQEAYEQFVDVIEMDTFGNQEYRQHFGEFVGRIVSTSVLEESQLSQAALRAEQEFDQQIKEKPMTARNYLMFMRFLNKTYQFNPERLNKSLVLFEKGIRLSPTRPHFYYESAYTKLYLGKHYRTLGQMEKAEQCFDQAVLDIKKAIDLNDQVVESYINLVMILFAVGRSQEVQAPLDTMDEQNLDYHYEEALRKMANSAVHAEEYQWTVKFYKELTVRVPNNANYWVNLALSYAHLGQREHAIETAGQVKLFGGDYAEQSEAFIEDVKAGKFEK